jgi:hypothetical protein
LRYCWIHVAVFSPENTEPSAYIIEYTRFTLSDMIIFQPFQFSSLSAIRARRDGSLGSPISFEVSRMISCHVTIMDFFDAGHVSPIENI